VGVGQPDRGGELAGLADPLQSGELAAAIEPVGAREDGLGPDVVVRHDDRDPGVHRGRADLVDRDVPDAHSRDVGDGVLSAGGVLADHDAEISGSHMLSVVDVFFRVGKECTSGRGCARESTEKE
jgi:hypothetical protein